MTVSGINVDENIKILEEEVRANEALSPEVKKSIKEHNEVIKILLERMARRRIGKKNSEKSPPPAKNKKSDSGKESRSERDQLPSKRYPDALVVEKELSFPGPPPCPCCNKDMVDSGLRETHEELSVIPRKFVIYRYHKQKYKCSSCHGGMAMPVASMRILPRSSYADDFILDVALSKYCDLIPIERYATMAAREGLKGLPPQSLIGLTHHLANFLEGVYSKLKEEVQRARIVHADETPHRMLEGGEGRKSWFMWGFSSETSCFFDIRKSRSGDIASEFLKTCSASYLVSDVFSGYAKAVSEVNIDRDERGTPALQAVYCNAHARRKFKEAEENFPEEVKTFLASYREIYRLEKEGSREKLGFYFEQMKREAKKLENSVSKNLSLGKAIGYFLKNYQGLTRCLDAGDVPLDNNQQERLLRNPVVGRKTWYGTHSKRGARTASVLFSLVNACHLNGVNPREYFPFLIDRTHGGSDPPTPHQYKKNFQDSRSSGQ